METIKKNKTIVYRQPAEWRDEGLNFAEHLTAYKREYLKIKGAIWKKKLQQKKNKNICKQAQQMRTMTKHHRKCKK